MSLALWLRTGRTERQLSLADVARITKIQPRILERLEGGKLDGLPAEVFVRGFIRSFAKCCGLDEAEALTRYTAASQAQAIATAPAMPGALAAPPTARAMVDAMADLAPQIARTTSPTRPIQVVELAEGSLTEIALGTVVERAEPVAAEPVATAAEPVPTATATAVEAPKPSKKKQRGKRRSKRGTQQTQQTPQTQTQQTQQTRMATGTPSAPMPVVEAPREDAVEAVEAAAPVEVAAPVAAPFDTSAAADVLVDAASATSTDADAANAAPICDHLDPLVEPADANEDIVATETWQPKMPPVTTTATVPWRRPYVAASTAAASVPTLVIDDADPDAAAQVVEDREAARSVLTNAQRRSFLPPILLDREDRGARQGGLTLAVIILLIAATLTLSYLMRRPSSSGDGVTFNDVVETTPERGVG